eukprot:11929_1
MIALRDENSNEKGCTSMQLHEHKLNASTMTSFMQTQTQEAKMIQQNLQHTVTDEKQAAHVNKIKWLHTLAKVDYCQSQSISNEADVQKIKHGIQELTVFSLCLNDASTEKATSENILNTIIPLLLSNKVSSFNDVVLSSSFKNFKNKWMQNLAKDTYDDVTSKITYNFGCNYFCEIYQLMMECNNSVSKTFENATERWTEQARQEQNDYESSRAKYWCQKMEQILNIIYKEELIVIKTLWPVPQIKWTEWETKLMRMWRCLLEQKIQIYKEEIKSIFSA